MNNQNIIMKGKRAAATQALIYVLKKTRESLTNKGARNLQHKNRLSDYLTFAKLLIGFPAIYASLDIRVSWVCAKRWSKIVLKEDICFKDVLLFWIFLNYILWLFKRYLYENDLTTTEVRHAYDLLKKRIFPSVISNRIPSGLFEIKRIYDTGLKGFNWQFFIGSAGCLLNDSACQLLSALFCANDNDVLVFSRMLVDASTGLSESNRLPFQKIKHNVQVVLKNLRDWLEGYCDKMCAYAVKSKDARCVELWNLARQDIAAIRSKAPCIENEQEINRLVAKFCRKANEAGALTCALRMVSLDQIAHMPKDSLAECRARIEFFKNCIENHDGYKLITEDTDERALQLMFWLVWYGSAMDINRECANGKGTCDYAISCGSNDKCVIEIKLGSNSSLSSGLKCQLDVYKKVNGTPKGIYLVVCKTEKEISHCRTIAEHCNLIEGDNIYIIDATNKVTASKLKMNHDGL